MKTFLPDPFQIKRLEKKINRPLTAIEREGEAPVRWKDANGKTQLEWVKRYNMRDFYGK
jgi:hypothetical protein